MPRAQKGQRFGGRQKGSYNKSTNEIRDIIDRVAKKHGGMGNLVGKLFELAEGIKIATKEGIVYTTPPSDSAMRIILEHRFGKPVQQVEGNLTVSKLLLDV